MENPRPEEEKVTKDIRNLFRLQKKTNGTKDKILRNFKNLFAHKEENYYKPV